MTYTVLSAPMNLRSLVLFLLIGLGHSPVSHARQINEVSELGPVRVSTTLTPESPTIGDEIQLEITVEYPADVEVLMPEFGEALSRYTILDFVPRQHIADDGSIVATQRYTLQPYLSGEQSITPILVEFIDNRAGKQPTPDDADAFEILTDRIDFLVKSVLPSEAANELKPLLGRLEPPREFSSSLWIWIIIGSLAATLSCLAAWIFTKRYREKVVRRTAYEIARRRLDTLLSGGIPKSETEIGQFFVSISSIVRKYLEDRFDMQAPDLTTEEFLALASASPDFSNDHQRLLQGFLKQADLVKFAGIHVDASAVEKSRDAAVRFLEDTRENAPLIQDELDESRITNGLHLAPPDPVEEVNV